MQSTNSATKQQPQPTTSTVTLRVNGQAYTASAGSRWDALAQVVEQAAQGEKKDAR